MLPDKKQFTSISKGAIAFLYIPQIPKKTPNNTIP